MKSCELCGYEYPKGLCPECFAQRVKPRSFYKQHYRLAKKMPWHCLSRPARQLVALQASTWQVPL